MRRIKSARRQASCCWCRGLSCGQSRGGELVGGWLGGAGRGVRTCMAVLHREHQGANTVCEREDSTHRDARQGCRRWSWRRCAIQIGGEAQHRTPTAIGQLDENVGGALWGSRLAQGEDLAKQGMGGVDDGDLASHLIG
jgi:hypothetical protein